MGDERFVLVNSDGVLGMASQLTQASWELDGVTVGLPESGADAVDNATHDFSAVITALNKSASTSLSALAQSATISMHAWEHAEAVLTRAMEQRKHRP